MKVNAWVVMINYENGDVEGFAFKDEDTALDCEMFYNMAKLLQISDIAKVTAPTLQMIDVATNVAMA